MNLQSLNFSLQQDWITSVFILIFVLFGVVKLIYKDRILDLATVYISNNYFKKYRRSNPSIFNGFHFLLFIISCLITSLALMVYFASFNPLLIEGNGFQSFVYFCGYTAVYFLGRSLINGIFLVLFNSRNFLKFMFSNTSFLYSSILLVVPFLLVVFFIKKEVSFLFDLLLGVIFLMTLLRYFYLIRGNKKLILNRWYYFFLYFCALEISPLLLILKLTSEIS